VEDVTTGDLVEQLLLQVYGDATKDAVPREVLVPADPPDLPELEALLTELRGARVAVRVPQRGDKRALLETVARNAGQALTLHKTRRAGDLTTRSKALQEIQDALSLGEAPLRIECYDVSNIQGQHVVASMVVFEDGLPRKSEYRRFTVRGTEGQDDVAAIHEVITRRFRRYLEDRENIPELDLGREEDDGSCDDDDRSDPARAGRIDASPIDPVTGRPRRFAYPPNLVVVDGGPPQVASAARALAELGIDDVALCGLAKRLEEVWLPEDDHPVVMPRTSEGLYLLQRVRDEAHRFAITHHRQRRSKAMTTSVLDEVPGLGPARQKALLRAFGSVKRLRAASAEEIASVQGIGPALAQAVVGALATRSPEPAVDTSTGEIIE
jgi:excinuclease ABC subunit C